MRQTFHFLAALGPIDFHTIRRDALLRWMAVLPFGIAILLRFFVPFVRARVLEQFAFDIAPYYPLLISMLVLMMPILFGTVIGFLLLDQREDGTLTALRVTPLSETGYLMYRMALPLVLSVVATLFMFPIVALVEINFVGQLLGALCAAPLAPLFALFLAAFAENQVQGFALSKGAGVFLIPPTLAYFVPMNWQLLCGILPPYWVAKVLWTAVANEPHIGFYFLIGVLYPCMLIFFLLKRFRRVTRV